MPRRSRLQHDIILKHALRLARHPRIAARLIPLEVEKSFFNLLHPRRANGKAGKIRQVSIRITDICNLRCHTCGQWGDSGFLVDRSGKGPGP